MAFFLVTARQCRKRWVNNGVVCALGMMLLVPSMEVMALPAHIEADRLILAAKSTLEKGDFNTAQNYLERIAPLGVEPPAEYHLLYGRVLYQSDALKQAKAQYESYVEKAGSKADAYIESLQRITELEERLLEQPALRKKGGVGNKQAQKPILRPAFAAAPEGKRYDQKVASLYLGSRLQQALLAEANSLLTAYPYLDRALSDSNVDGAIQYRLALGNRGELNISRKETHSNASAVMSVEHFSAYGVNTQVRYRCSQSQDSCVFAHPNTGQPWLKIARNEQGAAELAQALQRLIKSMQRK